MDLSLLYRLKGTLEGTAAHENGDRLGSGYVTAWPRLRREVVEAVPAYRAEIDRLFPEQLSTEHQAGEPQSEESIMLMAQLAGWLGGVIAEAEVQQRLAAQRAEASKPPMGFGAGSQPPDGGSPAARPEERRVPGGDAPAPGAGRDADRATP